MIEWVKSIIESIGYPGIAFLMIIENIFPPIPSEIIMPFAGFVAEQGQLSFFGVVAAGTVGSVLGTLPFYYLGYKIGEERLKQWADKHGRWLMLSSHDIAPYAGFNATTQQRFFFAGWYQALVHLFPFQPELNE